MTSITDVANLSLAQMGNRTQISSFTDGTQAAQAANLFYTPVTQMLLRAAPWDFARGQVTLTQLKATVIKGSLSNNPPPQPWQFEYAYPPDCLKGRFQLPTLQTQPQTSPPLTTAPNVGFPYSTPPTAIPFVPGTDFDANGNSIKVIFSNLYQAQLVYVRDLSQTPDLWDSSFLMALTAVLGCYFMNMLQPNEAKYKTLASVAQDLVLQARTAAANESISQSDHVPDWLAARMRGSVAWGWNNGGPGSAASWGNAWDSCLLPGLSF